MIAFPRHASKFLNSWQHGIEIIPAEAPSQVTKCTHYFSLKRKYIERYIKFIFLKKVVQFSVDIPLVLEVMEKLADTEDSIWLIQTLQEHYPRHVIDQLKVVLKAIEKYPLYINAAVKEMKRLGLTSANDLRDIAVSLEMQSSKQASKKEVINEKYKDMTAPERNQDIYLQVLQGGR